MLDEDKNVPNAENLKITDVPKEFVSAPYLKSAFLRGTVLFFSNSIETILIENRGPPRPISISVQVFPNQIIEGQKCNRLIENATRRNSDFNSKG